MGRGFAPILETAGSRAVLVRCRCEPDGGRTRRLRSWLETVAVDAPLAFLDHHFRYRRLSHRRPDTTPRFPARHVARDRNFCDGDCRCASFASRTSFRNSRDPVFLTGGSQTERTAFQTPLPAAEQRFENVADVWCASAIGAIEEGATPRTMLPLSRRSRRSVATAPKPLARSSTQAAGRWRKEG